MDVNRAQLGLIKEASVELLTQANQAYLARDGRSLLDLMGRLGISRGRLFAVPRGQCIEQ
jgi:hypothetical protein